MALLEEFDYEKVMDHHYGDARSARESMIKSFNIYWPNRSNCIARKRCKSVIEILRTLNARVAKIKTAKHW